jgi:hypothetical protein
MRDSGVINLTSPNLFGSMSKGNLNFPTNVDFIPNGTNGEVITIKGDSAVWKGLSTPMMQFWAYRYCSPLASVIDRLATADLNGKFDVIKNKGDNYSNSAAARNIYRLFNRPNPLQNYYEFRAQQVTFKKNYGFCPVYFMGVQLGDFKSAVFQWNLDPRFCEPIRNDKFDIFKEENSNPITEWRVTIHGKAYTIPAEKIMLLKDGFLERSIDELGLPLSKVDGLDWAISNICAAMEADNVLLRKKGPLGFISHQPTSDNVAGYIPMQPEEKEEIQNDLQQYGLTWSQFQYVITRQGVKWNPMSFNVKDLDTKGTIKEAIDMICDRYSYPAELMSGKNATYENRTSAERYVLNSVSIPENGRDMHTYTVQFGLEDERLFCDFSDYPALQDSKVSQGEGMKYQTEGLDMQFKNNLITLNQYRVALDWDTVPGDDIYYSSKEYQEKYGQFTPSKDTGKAQK